MIHQPHDKLELDLRPKERAELASVMRGVVLEAKRLREETENPRLIGLYGKITEQASRLEAELENKVKLMKADDVRFLRNYSGLGTLARKAIIRVWEREAVHD